METKKTLKTTRTAQSSTDWANRFSKQGFAKQKVFEQAHTLNDM